MTVFLIVLGIFVLLCIGIILYCIGIYNNIIGLKNQSENSWSQIKIQLNRRYDLIPNLVEAVKGYLKHESETLEKVIKARNIAAGSANISDNIKNENMLTGALKSLFMVMENYPELKANQNVMHLQEELVSTENKIAFSRQLYNDSAMQFNTLIQSFPQNLIANAFNFKQFDFFNVESEDVLKRPEVKF
ncbi:MAG TPA: LemA family protein [bacterium]|nr:LemA family protein [bacterium]HPN31944.1 LemA family protein [bacterium]